MATMLELTDLSGATRWMGVNGLRGFGAACPVYDPSKPPPILPEMWMLKFPEVDVSLPIGALKDPHKAPGGNLYWTLAAIPANSTSAKKGIALAAAISKKHFANYFGSGEDHAGMKMSDVLKTYKGKLVTKYGALTVPVMPIATERADHFVSRGGYLFWVDPDTGVFSNKQYIVPQAKITVPKGSQMPAGTFTLTKIDLFIRYTPSTNTVKYTIRRYITTGEKVEDAIQDVAALIANAGESLCKGVTSDKLATAAAYGAAVPSATPYIAGWTAAAAACGLAFPKCPPPPAGTVITPVPATVLNPTTEPQSLIDPAWYKKPATYAIAGSALAVVGAVVLFLRAR